MTGLELLLLRCARWLWPALAVAWALGLLWGLGSQHFAGAGWLLPLVLSALATHALARWADAVRERFIRESALPRPSSASCVKPSHIWAPETQNWPNARCANSS